ncbi:MAG: hypothetical protein QOH42_1948 [Blastocatellia bacterium]|nr:hypothetical protein [Blastocatellia bacterium]
MIGAQVYFPFHILRAIRVCKPAEAGCGVMLRQQPSRKTAGLVTLRASGVNAARQLARHSLSSSNVRLLLVLSRLNPGSR